MVMLCTCITLPTGVGAIGILNNGSTFGISGAHNIRLLIMYTIKWELTEIARDISVRCNYLREFVHIALAGILTSITYNQC